MSEEKKIKRGNKIASFDIRTEDIIDPEMDEVLREELMREADELEARLNSDPKLVGAGVGDDLFLSIVGKLKEQGVWEEDEEAAENVSAELEDEGEFETSDEEIEAAKRAEKALEVLGRVTDGAVAESAVKVADEERSEGSKDSAYIVNEEMSGGVGKEDSLEKLYEMLPEEDRKALELGRRMQEQGEKKALKKKKRRKVYRYAGVAAAMLVLVCGVGMSTEANRKVALQAWNAVMENFGFRTATNYVGEEFTVRSKSKEEVAAFEEIQEALQLPGIDFSYMPEGMEFLGYTYERESWEADLFYVYNESIINVKLINTDKEGVSYYSSDNQTMKKQTFLNKQNVEMELWKTDMSIPDERPQTYIGEAEYESCRCIINGKISADELKKIMEWMIFL